MKLPAGYEGAYEKAQKAAGITPKKRISMLEDEDYESDSDFGVPAFLNAFGGGVVAALRRMWAFFVTPR